MKDKLLNESEKDCVYDIVKRLKGKTELQKTRFYMYYSLGPNVNEKNSMSKIARYYGCSDSAIRDSIQSIGHALYRISDNEMMILKKIVGGKNRT